MSPYAQVIGFIYITVGLAFLMAFALRFSQKASASLEGTWILAAALWVSFDALVARPLTIFVRELLCPVLFGLRAALTARQILLEVAVELAEEERLLESTTAITPTGISPSTAMTMASGNRNNSGNSAAGGRFGPPAMAARRGALTGAENKESSTRGSGKGAIAWRKLKAIRRASLAMEATMDRPFGENSLAAQVPVDVVGCFCLCYCLCSFFSFQCFPFLSFPSISFLFFSLLSSSFLFFSSFLSSLSL